MAKKIAKMAALRVCASCEWIFKGGPGCPQCGFGSYGAHFAFGDAAYRYARTQRPWRERKMAAYSMQLDKQIAAALKPIPKGGRRFGT